MLRPWITPPRPSEVTGGIAEKDESSVKEASWGLKGKLLYILGLANDYSAPTPLLTLLTSGEPSDCPGAVFGQHALEMHPGPLLSPHEPQWTLSDDSPIYHGVLCA